MIEPTLTDHPLPFTDQVCLKKLNEQVGANGRTKAADWKARMAKRILEADEEHARKRERHA